jgi:hypothetical protein
LQYAVVIFFFNGGMMFKRAFAAFAACAMFGVVNAGPIILGGDDLHSHGSRNTTTNVNEDGWAYVQNALANLVAQSTYPSNDGTIVVLGSAPSTTTSGDGCGAPYWAGQSLVPVRTVTCIDTAASITAYLAGVANGTNRPRVIVYPGDDVGNDVDTTEEAAWLAGAAAISSYVAAGGGLLGHAGQYTWLSALVPGLTRVGTCDATPATLTPAGQAAFPAISNTNINAGPCHNTFTGTLGGLQVLATDANGLSFIIGGGAGTTFAARSSAVPVLPVGFAILLALALGGFAARRIVRKGK